MCQETSANRLSFLTKKRVPRIVYATLKKDFRGGIHGTSGTSGKRTEHGHISRLARLARAGGEDGRAHHCEWRPLGSRDGRNHADVDGGRQRKSPGNRLR